MPEGHVLHRAARLQSRKLAGRTLEVQSPQGRFAQGAKRLDGRELEGIDAKGKHIFYRFDGDDVLHVHLGLFGKFRMQTPPFPDPSPNARLVMSTQDDRLHLAGPTACEVLTTDEADAVAERLGPDPILAPADGADQVFHRLRRRTVPIGAAILDQKVIAGLGNVYRAELLFLVGVDPFTRANEVDRETIGELWDLSVTQLKAGERSGRIVTVDPAEVGAPSVSKLKRGERLHAYKRDGKRCRRCPDEIRTASIDSRNIWWCPTCQPEAGL
ncbi:MAG: DNA-formamidopyrimidine glycosylase family protein [Actinomycetota bacterium]